MEMWRRVARVQLLDDPDARDSSGLTPVDIARTWNKPAVTKVLARAATSGVR
jgi:hypothetical protein